MAHTLPVRRRTDSTPSRSVVRTRLDPVVVFIVPITVAVGIAVVLLTVLAANVLPDVRNADLILVVGVLDSCVAAFAGLMAQGRFRRDRRLQDAALSVGLRITAVAGLTDALLRVLDGSVPLLTAAMRIVAVLAIMVAGIAPGGRRVTRVGPRAVLVSAPVLVAVVAVPLLLALPAIPLDPDGDGATLELVVPGLDYLRPVDALLGILLIVAATGFWVRAMRARDGFLGLLGAAFLLGAAARFDYVLFPELHADVFSAGDVLRTACYAVILVAAFRETRSYWTARIELSMLEDRRRIARELHDGVVQELAYMRLEAAALGDDAGGRIVTAADRAIDESRGAVHALGAAGDDQLDVAIGETVTEMASRYGFAPELVLEPLPVESADERHAVLRIVREAVGNAVRNGRAESVRVTLHGGEAGRVLEVEDDGVGFDPAAMSRGYGLRSMRERAAAIGGTWSVESAPGSGTTVRAVW